MRINVFAGDERVFTEALHRGSAWAMQQGETTGSAITEEEAQILWRGVLGNVYGMHEWSSHGVRVNAHGPESIDDEEFWIVDVVHEDGFEDRFYLDVDTYLIARQRSDHALHPAIDPEIQRFETRYSDYREVDGVMFSFRQEKYDLDTDELVQHTTIRSLVLNSITDRSDFLMPE